MSGDHVVTAADAASVAELVRSSVDVTTVLGLARDLIRIPSSNPPGGESAVAEHLSEVLDRLALAPRIVESRSGRPSVLASTRPDPTAPRAPGDRPVLLVNGHIDTVPADPTHWRADPWAAEVIDGRLYGRGATDMKGGVASAIAGLIHCRELGLELPCDVTFHLVADEELGGTHGTAHLLAEGLIDADAAIVPEPTNLNLCIAERGLLFARITTHGVPAHGSEPLRGSSAIMSAVAIAQALHAREFLGPRHPLLGTTTCNVGMINGGSGPNVVAEQCVLQIDRRAAPGDTVESLVDGLQRRIATVGLSPDEYEIEVLTFCEPSEIAADDAFVTRLGEIAELATGRAPDTIGLPFATDARFLRNSLGIPTVVYGPGDLAVAHAVDEYVEIDELVLASTTFALLYSTFTGQK